MKPTTAAQAVAAARAVFEARVIVARTGGTIEQEEALHAYELRLYRHADELKASRATPPKGAP